MATQAAAEPVERALKPRERGPHGGRAGGGQGEICEGRVYIYRAIKGLGESLGRLQGRRGEQASAEGMGRIDRGRWRGAGQQERAPRDTKRAQMTPPNRIEPRAERSTTERRDPTACARTSFEGGEAGGEQRQTKSEPERGHNRRRCDAKSP